MNNTIVNMGVVVVKKIKKNIILMFLNSIMHFLALRMQVADIDCLPYFLNIIIIHMRQ